MKLFMIIGIGINFLLFCLMGLFAIKLIKKCPKRSMSILFAAAISMIVIGILVFKLLTLVWLLLSTT